MANTMPKSDTRCVAKANPVDTCACACARVLVYVCDQCQRWFADNPDFVEPLNETWFFEIRRGDLKTIQELVRQG